jgi:hypothetical protein
MDQSVDQRENATNNATAAIAPSTPTRCIWCAPFSPKLADPARKSTAARTMSTIQPGSLNRRSNRDTTPLKIHAFQSAPHHFDSSSHGLWVGRENGLDYAIHVSLNENSKSPEDRWT